MGNNGKGFLFVMDVIVLDILDENRSICSSRK